MAIDLFTFVIVLTLSLAFSLAYLSIRSFKRGIRDLPNAKKKLTDIESNFASFILRFNDDTQYLRHSKLTQLILELEPIKNDLKEMRNPYIAGKIFKLWSKIKSFEKNFEQERISLNKRFFEKETQRAVHIFRDNEGNDQLTEEQIRAVLSDDDRNLIIAGAGSGKTRVIEFKVRYLIHHKKVSPDRILLLSFSRKSAGDLLKKISESTPGVDARTIHSFCSQISDRKNKQVFNDSRNELGNFVVNALTQTLKDKHAFQLFQVFYGKYFSEQKPLIFYKDINELRTALRRSNSKFIEKYDQFGEIQLKKSLKTLQGEYVRSVDERYIADFLFLNDIRYEYEKQYPHIDSKYRPDFYLSDYHTYLEHYAVTANGSTPSYFRDPEKYLKGITWKRDLHKRNNTSLIESYSYLLNGKQSATYISEILVNGGIQLKTSTNENNIHKMITREFSSFFTRFYNSFKSSGLDITTLKEKYTESKYSSFLELFDRFLGHFNKLAEADNKIDFSDMIITAIQKYQNGHPRNYDYVIVDEFQDISNLEMNLLNVLYQSGKAPSLFCVGDDWQSIYGFNGSDVTILSNYESKYSGVLIQTLNDNFRSHQRIVDLGKAFISKNPAQIPKNVRSKNCSFKDSEINFLNFNQMEKRIEAIPEDESIFILYRYNTDCPADNGIFRELFKLDTYGKPIKKNNCARNISLMTIHGSKGLEAQHVFVLFPRGQNLTFPSDIEDHFVFNILKSGSDDFPFSEERRLMYVAITRAQQNLYFVSPSMGDSNSIFWDELKELAGNEPSIRKKSQHLPNRG